MAKSTVPLPVPAPVPLNVIHGALVVAFQAQPAWVESVTVPGSPEAGSSGASASPASLHGSAAWVIVNGWPPISTSRSADWRPRLPPPNSQPTRSRVALPALVIVTHGSGNSPSTHIQRRPPRPSRSRPRRARTQRPVSTCRWGSDRPASR